jgi:D-glycero-D-manno-heptose 1,7-bisphosphate phosphatase
VTRAAFLDRDGVLNEVRVEHGVPHPPNSADDLVVLPGVADACRRLRRGGFLLVVVTNQPDVARGTQSLGTVNEINDTLRQVLPLDAIYVCPHDDKDACNCRKPAPGLLLAAAAELEIDLALSTMIGDRWRDIEAGRRAGCATVHIDRDYAERRPTAADLTVRSLPEAVPWLLGRAPPPVG